MAILFLLAACGGGGSDAAPAPGPVPTPSPTPSPAPAPATAYGTCGLANFSAALLERINQLRAAGATCGSTAFAATGALRWGAQLTQAADGHSRDMEAQNYFSHTSMDGRTLSDRINATGYDWSRIGENIAAGQTSVDAVMNAWIGSAGHCANLMNPNFADVGVACVPRSGSATYSHYWTMNLGTPR